MVRYEGHWMLDGVEEATSYLDAESDEEALELIKDDSLWLSSENSDFCVDQVILYRVEEIDELEESFEIYKIVGDIQLSNNQIIEA